MDLVALAWVPIRVLRQDGRVDKLETPALPAKAPKKNSKAPLEVVHHGNLQWYTHCDTVQTHFLEWPEFQRFPQWVLDSGLLLGPDTDDDSSYDPSDDASDKFHYGDE